MPTYKRQSTLFSLLASGREIEDFDDPTIVSISGTYSTWVDVETGEYFLYVTPLVRTTDLPDRVTIFAQFSTKDDLLHQSVICDMYTSIDLIENPYQIDEQIVFRTVDHAILEEDYSTYNGISVKTSLTQIAWEPTWKLALNESYIGPELVGVGINEIRTGNMNDFRCSFFRSFE